GCVARSSHRGKRGRLTIVPFKSQAQRRKFAQLLVEGKILPQRLIKRRLGKLVGCPSWKDAGVVDEDVHIGGTVGEPAHIVRRLEVGAHELRLTTACLDGGDHLCATRLASATDQDTRTFACER